MYRGLYVASLAAAVVTYGCAQVVDHPPVTPPETGDLGDTQFSTDGGDSSSMCVAKTVTAQQIPLDMLILLDASTSMLDPATTPQKWSSVVAALTAFFDDPASKGISAGLTIFPAAGPKNTCVAGTYQTPQIDFGTLPGNRPTLVNAMANANPQVNDSTPLHSVAEGALAGAVDWKNTHVGHKVVVVLATDGVSTCITNVDPRTSAAKALTQGVQTFTIGMKGADPVELDGIAAAGGTTKTYDATNIALFSKQMEAIRSLALPCEVLIPPPPIGQTFDQDRVNVEYTPGTGGMTDTIPFVANASSCGTSGGWYYDNAAMPTKIMYCPTTCTRVQSDATATINVAFGCQTVIN
jgi:hypothetical protein